MKAAIVKYCLLAVLLFALGSAASAGFVNPPPQYDLQRTLLWDFTVENTWGVPYAEKGGDWGIGQWACDWQNDSGALTWYDTSSRWTGRQGFIGYDNTGGSQDVTGRWQIHINNFETNNALKFVWYEVELTQWGQVDSNASFELPVGFHAYKAVSGEPTPTGDGGARMHDTWIIWPNPTWETFIWDFTVKPGGGILVDKFYVSTACVPEPSSLMALGAGLMGFGSFLVRRKRG